MAFGDKGGLIAKRTLPIERGHAEALMPLYEECLKETGRASTDIEAVYVTVGPGSFTGLRVGLTVARFIGFSLNVPVHGITMFQAFSASVGGKGNRLVLLETKRSDYYVQIVDDTHAGVTKPSCVIGDDVQKMTEGLSLITGDAVNRFQAEMNIGNSAQYVQQDSITLDNVVKAIINNEFEYSEPDAFYIRDADVSQPKKHKI